MTTVTMDAMGLSEAVYSGVTSDGDARVMSDRVRSLADAVYREFERLIRTYDENVVKEMMPLIIGILENLDEAMQDKQESEVDLELAREDNEQLLTQYEREKQLKKSMEQKYLQYEEASEEERKELRSKLDSLQSITRMFEIKMKNAQDQISRYEERESEAKREYSKLHERYTDLFKAHVDYRERTKLLLGTDKPSVETVTAKTSTTTLLSPRSPDVISDDVGVQLSRPSASPSTSPRSRRRYVEHGTNLQCELDELQKSKDGGFTDITKMKQTNTGVEFKDEATETINAPSDTEYLLHCGPKNIGVSTSNIIRNFGDMQTMEFEEDTPPVSNRSAEKNASSIYDELQDTDALGQVDYGSDIAGMSREVENLIQENNELLATKNALNVVKDDLIARVDDLTTEKEQFREEVISLQVVRDKMQERIAALEAEAKARELEKQATVATPAGDEEDDIPVMQRKRFTRVEMARVLMERNQYKERLMELQEAVRWTEMIRASKEHPELVGSGEGKKKSYLWNIFGNLFSSSSRPAKKPSPVATVRYTANSSTSSASGGSSVVPVGDPNKEQREKHIGAKKSKAFDYLQDDLKKQANAGRQRSGSETGGSVSHPRDKVRLLTDKARNLREQERRQAQYKEMRAAVKKDDGRLQAYGWSLPAKLSSALLDATASPSSSSSKTSSAQCLPIPVPVYCRPIMDDDDGMKVWCAAAVNLAGGRTRDGGSIVGASVFYSSRVVDNSEINSTADDIEKLSQELQNHERTVKEADDDGQLSSLVWICTTNSSHGSEVTVVDANSPGDVLENFQACSTHLLCISSVPGAMESDYALCDDVISCDTDPVSAIAVAAESPSGGTAVDEESGTFRPLGRITLVHCTAGEFDATSIHSAGEFDGSESPSDALLNKLDQSGSLSLPGESPQSHVGVRSRRILREPKDELVRDGISTGVQGNGLVSEQVDKSTSVLPTMWLGAQSGSIYVHSAVSQWKRCLHTVRLKDSVLAINHVKGRVFVALADGTVAVFRRSSCGQWDLSSYHLIELGSAQSQYSVRCLCVVADKHVWCGHRNNIHVINSHTLQLEKCFDAHPRRESQVRQMAWLGDGVWVSIRLDSTLRLYHAYTHQHLQDVDVEPYVSKILGTGKLGFSFVRISCLMASCNRLWIGTGNGVIVSVPLSKTNDSGILTSISANENKQTLALSAGSSGARPGGAMGPGRPGGVVRVYTDGSGDMVIPGSFIPYCSIAQAQLSFHGHKDAIKFFVTVPGSPTRSLSGVLSSGDKDECGKEGAKNCKKTTLVISGGEGYVDFRIGDIDDDTGGDIAEERKMAALSKGDRSHLIVWQVISPS